MNDELKIILRYYPRICLQGLKKPRKHFSVRIAGVQVGIRSKYLPNICPERYRYTTQVPFNDPNTLTFLTYWRILTDSRRPIFQLI